jgi:hypothetical protein
VSPHWCLYLEQTQVNVGKHLVDAICIRHRRVEHRLLKGLVPTLTPVLGGSVVKHNGVGVIGRQQVTQVIEGELGIQPGDTCA